MAIIIKTYSPPMFLLFFVFYIYVGLFFLIYFVIGGIAITIVFLL
jgi:hypothetical protein